MGKIFDELSKSQMQKLFDLLGVHRYKYNINQEILSTIKNENIIGIVMSGYAQIINNEYNGNEVIVEELFENSVFGSNISGTNNENYEIIARDETDVLVIDYDKIMNPKNLKYIFFNIFLKNLFDIVNSKYKQSNERIRILEKKQIRDKLLEFFEIEHKKSGSKNIYMKSTFKDLADFIAVNRSAMFRELKHLKEEKFIEVKGNKVTLLYK